MGGQAWLTIGLQVIPWIAAAGAVYSKLCSIEKRLERGQQKFDRADEARMWMEARVARIEQHCADVHGQRWRGSEQ